MKQMSDLIGSRWEGKSELWEDPLGNVAQESECAAFIDEGVVRYTWSREGKAHDGEITLGAEGATFRDSFHQQEPVACRAVPGGAALVTLQYTYMDVWGWRISLCHREPTGELVVQMTNITPWGEEGRAVRMVLKRVAA